VTAYKPKMVVLYAGDNDLNAGKSPKQVASDFEEFVARVHKELPETKIAYIAIKPSPSRWKLIDQMKEANRLIREQCETNHKLIYVDIVKPMLDDNGQPRQELYKKDMLHMDDDGYQIWADRLRQHLSK